MSLTGRSLNKSLIITDVPSYKFNESIPYLLGHLFLAEDFAHVIELDGPAGTLAGLLRLNGQIANVAEGAEGLASEAHSLHCEDVVKLTDFRGCATLGNDVKIYLLDT